MSGINLLRNGGRRAHHLFFNRHPRPSSNPQPQPQPHSRSYFRPTKNPLFSKSPNPSSSSSHVAPPTLATSASSSSSSSAGRGGFVSWYLGMIEARPLITKGLTAGAIFTAADLSSQMITLKAADSLDLMRTLRMATYGMLLSGPSLHIWFNTMSRFLPKRDIVTTLKKMFLGQTLYGPLMTCIFFSVNAGLQGETSAEIFARLKRDVIPTLISGLVYWPMCDFITFKFLPVRLQPLMSNSFAFLWTIYITYMASLQKATVASVEA